MTQQINNKISFLESFLNTSLSKDGVNISVWCPFCNNPNRNKLKLAIQLEKNIYHCWVCDKKGTNIPQLIRRINSSKFDESKKIFTSNKNKESLKNFLEDYEDVIIEEAVSLPEDFRLLAFCFNDKDPDIRDTFQYAIKRGINKHKMLMLRAGISKDPNFRRCLILPSINKEGNLNFYTSRRIDANTNDSFKYNNANIQKKNIIFNEINIDWNIPLTLVEGPLDLIKVNDNSTCLLGSSLNESMLLFNKIVAHKTQINLALDKDAYYKAIKIAELLTQYDVEVNIIDTRIADDVGDMTRKQFEVALEEAKTFNRKDSLMAKINNL